MRSLFAICANFIKIHLITEKCLDIKMQKRG